MVVRGCEGLFGAAEGSCGCLGSCLGDTGPPISDRTSDKGGSRVRICCRRFLSQSRLSKEVRGRG